MCRLTNIFTCLEHTQYIPKTFWHIYFQRVFVKLWREWEESGGLTGKQLMGTSSSALTLSTPRAALSTHLASGWILYKTKVRCAEFRIWTFSNDWSFEDYMGELNCTVSGCNERYPCHSNLLLGRTSKKITNTTLGAWTWPQCRLPTSAQQPSLFPQGSSSKRAISWRIFCIQMIMMSGGCGCEKGFQDGHSNQPSGR